MHKLLGVPIQDELVPGFNMGQGPDKANFTMSTAPAKIGTSSWGSRPRVNPCIILEELGSSKH